MAIGAQETLPFREGASAPDGSPIPDGTFTPPEPEPRIHTLEELQSDVRRHRGLLGTAASMAAHAMLVGAAVAGPLLVEGPLPKMQDGVRTFLAEPLELAPPPPPPPLPSSRSVSADGSRNPAG